MAAINKKSTYWDSFAGLVACKVIERLDINGREYARIRITARKARTYMIGEVHAVPVDRVIPGDKIRVSSGSYRISGHI